MKKIIYPLLTRRFTLLRGPVFYFSDQHYLAHANETDHGVILRFCPNDYQGLLTSRFRCVYYEAADEIDEDAISSTGQLLAFTLNYFSSADPLSFPFSIVIDDTGRRKTATFNADSSSEFLSSKTSERYRLQAGTTAGELQKLFAVTSKALETDARVKIMTDRFNSALRRQRLEDQIIDLSVALESMLDETAEISFRLSLFLSFVCRQDKKTAYDLFKSFYDVRSRIVHGSTHQVRAQRSVDDFRTRMPDLIRYAKAAMLYFYTYLNQPPPHDWGKHCLGLILGSEEPVIQ